jgi:hypothetical protein
MYLPLTIRVTRMLKKSRSIRRSALLKMQRSKNFISLTKSTSLEGMNTAGKSSPYIAGYVGESNPAPSNQEPKTLYLTFVGEGNQWRHWVKTRLTVVPLPLLNLTTLNDERLSRMQHADSSFCTRATTLLMKLSAKISAIGICTQGMSWSCGMVPPPS